MTSTLLTIDKRESKIIPFIEAEFELGPTFSDNTGPDGMPIITDYTSKQMDVGDYIISSTFQTPENESKTVIHACIERKSLRDFSASIKDGRLDNIEKMVNLRRESECMLFLLIEGPANPELTTEYAGIPYSKILASIDSTMIKYNIQVIHAGTPLKTAKRLKFLTESFARHFVRNVLPELGNQTPGAVPVFGNMEEPIGKSGFTPEQKEQKSIIAMWSSVKGISPPTAMLLAQNFTLRQYLLGEITEANLRAIVNPKTGRGLATRSVNSVLNSLTFLDSSDDGQAAKFIAACPGISKDSATNMVFAHTLRQLINMPADELRNVPVSSSKKCGPARAKTLLAMLEKKLNATQN